MINKIFFIYFLLFIFFSCASTPKTPMDYFERGITKSEKKDYAGAIDDYDKAIALGTRDSSSLVRVVNQTTKMILSLSMVYYNRACSKEYLGNHIGAIEDYNKVIEIDPKDGAAYYNRSIIKMNLGDKKGSIEDLKEAQKLGYSK